MASATHNNPALNQAETSDASRMVLVITEWTTMINHIVALQEWMQQQM